MDYYAKYLKYKDKYMHLKHMHSQTGGNGIMMSGTQRFTKPDYESNLDKDTNYAYCPDDKPTMCGIETNSFGLCKNDKSECDKSDINGVIPEAVGYNKDEGAKFGYASVNLHKRCNKLDIFKHEEIRNDGPKTIPAKFKIMTCNLWGILRKPKPLEPRLVDLTDPIVIESERKKYFEEQTKYKFMLSVMQIRMHAIARNIKKHKPDIVCFQEMSSITYRLLSKYVGDLYPYKYEENPQIDDSKAKRNRDIETYIFSKHMAKEYTVYNIGGNLNYNNSLIVVKFDNLAVYNCYLQAGSRNSPGQEKQWMHYARCRKDQITNILKLISESRDESVVVVGDFNCHLDGKLEDWEELRDIKSVLRDSYRDVNPVDSGLTEDTDVNHMRWNNKFTEKKLRYDGILYKGLIRPESSLVICKEQIPLNKQQSEKFEKYMVARPDPSKLRYYDSEKKLYSLSPSDHFSVVTTFKR